MQGNTSVIHVHSTQKVLAVEICGKLPGLKLMREGAASGTGSRPPVMCACSACAGDYEDPDRSPWATDGGEIEDVGVPRAEGEEFPAES